MNNNKQNSTNPNRPRRSNRLADAARGGDHERRIIRQQRAFDLRSRDLTYEQIAREMNVSRSTAWELVEKYWAVAAERLGEKADRVRHIEYLRLLRILRHHEPIALGETAHDHAAECKSAAIVLRCHERICKLFGLYAPLRVEARTGPTTYATPEEVAEAVRRASPLLAGIDIEAAARELGTRTISYGPGSANT